MNDVMVAVMIALGSSADDIAESNCVSKAMTLMIETERLPLVALS